MSEPHKPWEPDPAKLGNWQSMFEPRRNGTTPPPEQPTVTAAAMSDDVDVPRIDPCEYRPWILLRGQLRSTMMLGLRWFDAKAGLWHGTAIPYFSLNAIDTIGERMVSLDFGARQFVIEGSGLDELARRLQQGDVAKIV